MENYIVINGKRAELTKEQLKQLGIKEEYRNPFTRVGKNEIYFTLNGLCPLKEVNDNFDDDRFKDGNYFNDKNFAQQAYWHMLLNCRLLKYAYEHSSEVTKEDWTSDAGMRKYFIMYHPKEKYYSLASGIYNKSNDVYFKTEIVARHAIDDVVKPFMKEHPEFVW